MLKVLICDDEIKVCKLIKNLIDWKTMDMEIVGISYNGIAALEMIEEKKPDIVIADIRMPGYSGLEILRRIREEMLDIEYIIISGYKDFEYAHTALKYNVSDYLIKPIEKDELIKVLTSIKNERMKRWQQEETQELLKKELEENKSKIAAQFIELMWQRKNVDIKNLNLNNGETHADEKYNVFMIKYDFSHDLDKERKDMVLDKQKKMMEDFLKPLSNSIVIEWHWNTIVGIFSFMQENEQKIYENMEFWHQELLNHALKFFDVFITFGIGTAINDISQINIVFQNVRYAIRARIIMGMNRIIYYNHLTRANIALNEILTVKRLEEFRNKINVGDRRALEMLLKTLFLEASFKNADIQLLFSICYELMDEFIIHVAKNEKIDRADIEDKVEFGLENASTVKEMQDVLINIFNEYFDRLEIARSAVKTRSAYLARSYIKEHFAENICLESVAKIVHLNPVYLSMMFKKEFKIGFYNYLMNYRMDTAKKLLKDTNQHIYEIATNVGYNDSKYFSKVFKSKIGMNPNEFRTFTRRW